MICDGKPAHWPKMLLSKGEDEHSAVRALSEVRRLIIDYRRSQTRDWRLKHAQTDNIVNVVGGLIADAVAIDALYDRADKALRPLQEENERLREKLAESKRPFSAQMEMQNRRIIDLTAQLDKLRGLR